jgi:phosphopantothenoylcysteine decarboxylase/phosphopantothenate--cysteine ligase
LSLNLTANADILSWAAGGKDHRLAVGFALETEDGERNANEKLDRKKLDLICLNRADEEDSGMDSDMNRITLIDRKHRVDALPLMPKWEVSRKIWDKIEQLMAEGRG